MSPPASRIFALAQASDLRPIQDSLNAPAQTARRLRLRRPDRLYHLHHERHVDGLHGHLAEDRAAIGVERVHPLLAVLCVAPTRRVSLDVGIPAFVEGHRLRRFPRSLRLYRLSMFNWINPRLTKFATLACLLSGFRQAD